MLFCVVTSYIHVIYMLSMELRNNSVSFDFLFEYILSNSSGRYTHGTTYISTSDYAPDLSVCVYIIIQCFHYIYIYILKSQHFPAFHSREINSCVHFLGIMLTMLTEHWHYQGVIVILEASLDSPTTLCSFVTGHDDQSHVLRNQLRDIRIKNTEIN